MDSIFSDDEEFDAIHEQLFDGAIEDESKQMVSMFGLYALRADNEQKPRKDIFLRGMEAPTNDMDPYKASSFEQNKAPIVKKSTLGENFAFFGMKQGRVRIEDKTTSASNLVAERNSLLEKLKDMNAEKEEYKDSDGSSGDENIDPMISERKPMKALRTNMNSPALRRSVRKRKRVAEISSDEESDTDSNTHPSLMCSPRKKRVSPA